MADKNGGSLAEPMSEQMWLDLYRKAVSELAEGKPDFTAVFAGNEFDLAILFQRLDKGQLKPK
jgi:hypothetical protein